MAKLIQACTASPCPALRQEQAKLARLRPNAQAAAAVYDPPGNRTPPDGYREATPAELRQMNLKPDMLEHPVNPKTKLPSQFRAAVFVDEKTGDRIVAFKGSSESEDWVNNRQQALGQDSFYYTQAQLIGNNVAASPLAAQTNVAGHSLGGGLAAAAARTSGMSASTFNAATLQDATVKNPALKQGVIDAVNTRGEPLTRGQQAIGNVTKGITPYPLDPPRNFGENLAKDIPWYNLRQQKDAFVERQKALHSMETMKGALARRSGEVEAALVQNHCP